MIGNKVNKTTIVAGSILLGLVIVGTVFLSATGHDTAALVNFVTGLIAAIPGLAAYDKAKNAESNSATAVTQTNGRITELIAANNALSDAINASPVLPSVPAVNDAGTLTTTEDGSNA